MRTRRRTVLGRCGMTSKTTQAAAAALVTALATSAWAQGGPPPGGAAPPPPTTAPPAPAQPPAPPPPGYGQPPPGYYPPPGYGAPPGYALPPGYGQPPGYALPPGYGQPPEGYSQLGPKEMEYFEGDPVPDGYRKATRIRRGLVIAGATTFGAAWMLSVITASISVDVHGGVSGNMTESDSATLYIPVAGPFVSLATYDPSATGSLTLVLDGLAQSGGIAMLIAGLAAQQTYLRRTSRAERTVQLRPLAGPGLAGMGLGGAF